MTIHRHFIVNKPYGFLSQFVDNSAERKGLLGELFDFPDGVMAVGRLDKDSEGLLFITSDGKLSNYIRSNNIEKEYHVQVDGEIDDVAIENLKNGVEIYTAGKHFLTSSCKVERLINIPDLAPIITLKRNKKQQGPSSRISITIKEGRKRQVRKMTGIVGFPTIRLLRVRIGSVYLNDMKPGEVLEVSSFGEEISKGYDLLKHSNETTIS